MTFSSCRLRHRSIHSLLRRGSLHHAGPQLHRRSLLTLAIETSCDDTAVAVLQRSDDSTRPPQAPRYSLLFNERIVSDNREFRGIMPSVAARGHETSLAPLVQKAIEALPDHDAQRAWGQIPSLAGTVAKQKPDFVTVTRGPGIAGNLAIGLSFAKGLAVAWNVPLLGVHHMQAHALTPRLAQALGMNMDPVSSGAGDDHVDNVPEVTKEEKDEHGGGGDPLAFPFLSLLVSGGHSQLVHSRSLTDHRIIINTVDTAIGNSLDQAAREILPADLLSSSADVSYGRVLESFAFPPDLPPTENYAFFKPTASRKEEVEAGHTRAAKLTNIAAAPATTVTEEAEKEPQLDWTLSQPFRETRKLAYSFTSLYTDVAKIMKSKPDMSVDERRILARHTFAAAFRQLVNRIVIALQDYPSTTSKTGHPPNKTPEDGEATATTASLQACRTLVVSGGVASNKFLMHVLRETLRVRGFGHLRVLAPPAHLCTDNAAMIAWTGMEMWQAGWRSELGIGTIRKWPMDPSRDQRGIMGVDGWVRRE